MVATDIATELRPFEALGLAGKRVLVVASTGGHLTQAMRLWDLMGLHPESRVVTFRSPQSERLTQGHETTFVPYVAPRDTWGVIRTRRLIRQLLRADRYDAILSTGAAVALSALPGLSRRPRRIYVESFSRFDGPSLTGRIVQRLPSIETYTQHAEWADRRWRYVGSITPSAASPRFAARRHNGPPRILVSLGTIRPYRFDALVDRVAELLPPQAEVTWQLGATTRTDLPGESFEMVDVDSFERLALASDVVVTHAGVGTALTLAELGVRTILVPRRAHRGEHVDDHQVQICIDFASRGLAQYREVDELSKADLLRQE